MELFLEKAGRAALVRAPPGGGQRKRTSSATI
jgi:hypothetical protein